VQNSRKEVINGKLKKMITTYNYYYYMYMDLSLRCFLLHFLIAEVGQ